MSSRIKKAALHVARKLHEKLCDRGEFTQNEFRDGLQPLLEPFRGDTFDDFCDQIAETVDTQSRNEKPGEGQPCFPGWDLGGVYALGDSRRVAKRMANKRHMEEALQVSAHNLAAVTLAHDEKQTEFDLLAPYWRDGMTKLQAVEAYQRSQPGAA